MTKCSKCGIDVGPTKARKDSVVFCYDCHKEFREKLNEKDLTGYNCSERLYEKLLGEFLGDEL